MRLHVSRLLPSLALALVALVLLMGAATSPTLPKESSKLIILSTTDVKGKTSPCG
jgi:hypothetical protein